MRSPIAVAGDTVPFGSARACDPCGVGLRNTDGNGAVVPGAAQKIFSGAVSNDATLVDDDGTRADCLDLFKDVRRYDDGFVRRHLADQLAHVMLLVGVEAVRRLVHDQNGRIVKDGLRNADAALEAF